MNKFDAIFSTTFTKLLKKFREMFSIQKSTEAFQVCDTNTENLNFRYKYVQLTK